MEELGPIESPLLRSRLHIRSGRRRLRQRKFQAAIGTLYDSLIYGLLYQANLTNTNSIYEEYEAVSVLTKNGILKNFNLQEYENKMEKVLVNEEIDYYQFHCKITDILHILGVLPFDLSTLPEEQSGIY